MRVEIVVRAEDVDALLRGVHRFEAGHMDARDEQGPARCGGFRLQNEPVASTCAGDVSRVVI